MFAAAASAVTSLALHGSVLAAVILWGEAKPGAAVHPTEAISVEIVRSDVLEAARPAPSREAAASASAVQPVLGAQEDTTATALPEQPDTAAPPEAPAKASRVMKAVPEASAIAEDPPEEVRKEIAEPEPALAAASAAAPPEKVIPPPVERPPPATKVEQEEPLKARKVPARKSSRQAQRKGAAQSRAARGSARSSGRISASTGSASSYASAVRARVASRKPPGLGGRGTVVVTFGVTTSGGLSFASILRSSGDPRLDHRVLAAVRSAAPFPAPPAGASPSQRRFSVPFYFQ